MTCSSIAAWEWHSQSCCFLGSPRHNFEVQGESIHWLVSRRVCPWPIWFCCPPPEQRWTPPLRTHNNKTVKWNMWQPCFVIFRDNLYSIPLSCTGIGLHSLYCHKVGNGYPPHLATSQCEFYTLVDYWEIVQQLESDIELHGFYTATWLFAFTFESAFLSVFFCASAPWARKQK